MTTFAYFLEILIKVPPSEKKKFRNFALFVQLGFLPSPWEPECFPGGSVAKNPPASAGDTRNMGSLSGSGRSPGEGNGTSLQYSYLGNSMDRGAWWVIYHGVAKSCVTVQLSMRALHGISK